MTFISVFGTLFGLIMASIGGFSLGLTMIDETKNEGAGASVCEMLLSMSILLGGNFIAASFMAGGLKRFIEVAL